MIFLLLQAIEDEDQRKIVERICDLYYRHMMKIAWNILKHPQDAEDAVQDAICNISINYEQFADPESTATIALVSTYTRNAAFNIYNHKKRTNGLFTSMEDPEYLNLIATDEQSLDRILENRDTAELIRWAVNQLDEPYRSVIKLKYFFHHRNVQIARVLHTTPNDINGKIFRAKKKLRKILKDKI